MEDKSRATGNGKRSWKYRRSGNSNRTGNSQSLEDENNEHSGPDPQCPLLPSEQPQREPSWSERSPAERSAGSGGRRSLGRSLFRKLLYDNEEETDCTVESELDLRVGGTWTIVLGKVGEEPFRETNVFTEIGRPLRLVSTRRRCSRGSTAGASTLRSLIDCLHATEPEERWCSVDYSFVLFFLGTTIAGAIVAAAISVLGFVPRVRGSKTIFTVHWIP